MVSQPVLQVAGSGCFQDWQEIADDNYPFEFSIHLPDPGEKLKLKWIAVDMNGNIKESKEFELVN